MFPAVLPQELAFAMTLFVGAANGQTHNLLAPQDDSQDSSQHSSQNAVKDAAQQDTPEAAERHDGRTQAQPFFLDLIFPLLAPVTPRSRENALKSPLFRAFYTTWSEYDGHPHRASLCARVLGFFCLMERTNGSILAPWTLPQESVEHILLAPVVIDALAAVPLTPTGVLEQSVLLTAIEAASHIDRPPAPPIPVPMSAWPAGTGELCSLMRTHDWTSSPLGSASTWPQPLRTAIELALACRFPMIVLWGPQLLQFYNDAYRDIMGTKHPAGLGQPTALCWPEVWQFNQPVYDRVRQGDSLTFENLLFPINRYGFLEDAWFTLCYSPLRDGQALIQGVLVTVFETTPRARLSSRQASQMAGTGEDDTPSTMPGYLPYLHGFRISTPLRLNF